MTLRAHPAISTRLGDQVVDLDQGIAPLVRHLWDLGLPTQSSCERDHGWSSAGPIWSDHAYLGFDTTSGVLGFLALIETITPADHERALTDPGNLPPLRGAWAAEPEHPLRTLGDRWSYAAEPWSTDDRRYSGLVVFVAFPCAVLDTLVVTIPLGNG